MLLITNEDVEKILTAKNCVEAMENAFRDLASGYAINRPRSHTYTPLPAEPGEENRYYMFKSMDGALPRYGIHAIRMSSDMLSERIVNGRERRTKLPLALGNRYVGMVILFSIHTLEPLAIIQDGLLQQMRVGATSAVAAKCLANPDSKRMGLIGTGNQARTAIPNMLAAFPGIESIKVFSLTPENRRAFVEGWQKELGPMIQCVETVEEAIQDIDLLSCVTNSSTPVVDFNLVPEGVHVNSVIGTELDMAIYERAKVIVVREKSEPTFWWMGDKAPWEASRAKSIKKGDMDTSKVHTLGEILAGKAEGRTSKKDITLFTGGGGGGSAGLGTQFAAIAAMIFKAAQEKGMGKDIPTEWFCQTYKP